MKKLIPAFMTLVFLGHTVVHASPELKSDDDRILYTLGVKIMMDLTPFQLKKREVAIIQQGMLDALVGEFVMDPNQYRDRIDTLAQTRIAERVKTESKRGKAYLESMKSKPGAQVSESGMVWFLHKKGKGRKPTASSLVRVHYRGTLVDGTEFDSTAKQGKPAEFPLDRVIPCWTDGFTQLPVGSKAKLVCPPEIAYGNRGAAPVVPPGATLIFEVELLEIMRKKK